MALLRVKDDKARAWYEKEALEQTWAVRTLQRNIETQYYYRLLSSQNAESVETEMKRLTSYLTGWDQLLMGKSTSALRFLFG